MSPEKGMLVEGNLVKEKRGRDSGEINAYLVGTGQRGWGGGVGRTMRNGIIG